MWTVRSLSRPPMLLQHHRDLHLPRNSQHSYTKQISSKSIQWSRCHRGQNLPFPINLVIAFTTFTTVQAMPHNHDWWVVVLRPTRHKIGHFGDVSPSESLGLVWKNTKPNATKAHIHNQKKRTTTQSKRKILKPGIVALYDIWPGNRPGLFSKKKTSKGGVGVEFNAPLDTI